MATIQDRYYAERNGKRVRTSYTGAKRYRVRYRDASGDQRAQSFVRKIDAQEFLVGLEHNLRAGTYIDPAKGKRKFGDYWTSWREARVDLRASTTARDDSYYRNHIEPTFGRAALGAIDRQMLRKWIAELVAKGLAPKTVHQAFNLVSQTLGEAAAEHLITANPAADMRKTLPEIIPVEMRILTPDEAATLEDVLDKRYRLWLQTAVETGLRFGELAALRPDRFDLLRRRVAVTETLSDVRGHISYGPPKTRAGRRHAPMTKDLASSLTTATAGMASDALLFTAPNGGPIRASLFRRRVWQPGCIEAGLGSMVPVDPEDEDGDKRYEGLRIHDLRHTAISWWIAAGADVKQIAVWAGHSSVATVLDRYGHLLPDRDDGVMEALEAIKQSGKPKDADVVQLRAADDET
jgi:integrase